MIQDGLKVTHYDATKYACLGTPVDVECFRSWKYILENNNINEQNVVDVYKFWKNYFDK